MTVAKNVLNKQLVALQADNKKVALAVKLTNEQERKHMCKAYMWWRDACKAKDYLVELYKANGIAHKNLRNKINFRPLLKLLSEGEISDTDLDLWNKVLNKVHEEFGGNAKHYATDAVERLSHYIFNEGGKTGLAGYHNKVDADFEEVDVGGLSVDAKQVKAWDAELDDKEYQSVFAAAAKEFYGNGKTMQKASFPAMPQTQDGYSLVVVKSDGTTKNVMNVFNDSNMLNNLLADAYRKDFSAMPVTMRSVLEPLHLLNVPNAVAQNIDLFIENSKVESAWFDGKKIQAHKRLVYRQATGDFLLSNICVDAGVVVTAKPLHKGMFTKLDGDVCLSNIQRRSIEVRLLHKQMFNMYTTNSTQRFQALPEGGLFAYQLKLENKLQIEDEDGVDGELVAQSIKNFNHPPIGFQPFYQEAKTLHPQVDLGEDGLDSTWNCDVTTDWLSHATSEFFDNWIAAYAKKHKRTINKTLNLGFTKKGLSIGYEFGEDGYDCDKQMAMQGAVGKAQLIVRSTDFAFVMKQLADLDIKGSVCMAASSQGIELTFATATHRYTCMVPACDEDGERSSELFSQYTPEQTEIELDFDADDAESHLTDDEFAEIAKGVLQ
jgi:hypothetical protein